MATWTRVSTAVTILLCYHYILFYIQALLWLFWGRGFQGSICVRFFESWLSIFSPTRCHGHDVFMALWCIIQDLPTRLWFSILMVAIQHNWLTLDCIFVKSECNGYSYGCGFWWSQPWVWVGCSSVAYSCPGDLSVAYSLSPSGSPSSKWCFEAVHKSTQKRTSECAGIKKQITKIFIVRDQNSAHEISGTPLYNKKLQSRSIEPTTKICITINKKGRWHTI